MATCALCGKATGRQRACQHCGTPADVITTPEELDRLQNEPRGHVGGFPVVAAVMLLGLLAAGALVYSVLGRGDSERVSATASLSLTGGPVVAGLRTGDCFVAASVQPTSDEIRPTRCDDPDALVVRRFAPAPDPLGAPYPGVDAVAAQAVELCAGSVVAVGPGPRAWSAGDRNVVCADYVV